MQIVVNGQNMDIHSDASIHELIMVLNLAGKRIAIERNGNIIPKGLYTQTPLAEHDRLEIVVAVGGG